MASSPPPSASALPPPPPPLASPQPPVPPNNSEETEDIPSAVSQIKALLQQLLRITTNDGRIFIGTFAGTDKPLNIVLINADEFRIDASGACSEGRFVGQVMFPWKIVVKVEAQARKQSKRGLSRIDQDDREGMYI